MPHDEILISFIECRIKGSWKNISAPHGVTAFLREALDSNSCFIDIIEIDTVRRYLHFKKGSVVSIVGNVLRYDTEDALEIITIDEKEQQKNRDKLPFD